MSNMRIPAYLRQIESRPADRIAFVDCALESRFAGQLDRAVVFSMNPIALLSLRCLEVEPIRLEDVCSTEYLLTIHAQVAGLVRGLRTEFDSTDLAVCYPNLFQVPAYYLTILFFPLSVVC